jgi:hypothetical protein
VSLRARVVALVAAAAVIGPACGGSNSGPIGTASCSPQGTSLNLLARNTAFDTKCLAAPADTAFTIVLDNQDPGVPHSVSIFSSNPTVDASAGELFKGKIVTGPTQVTYDVHALPAGRYFFECAVHPTQMNGTFLVG